MFRFLLTLVCLAGILGWARGESRNEHWSMHSTVLSEDRPIGVHLPDGYGKGNGAYPVLYTLDGETLFCP